MKEQKYKKLRNKNSYMDAFLQRRKQAADFALEKRNASGYKYTKPQFYINDEKLFLSSIVTSMTTPLSLFKAFLPKIVHYFFLS